MLVAKPVPPPLPTLRAVPTSQLGGARDPLPRRLARSAGGHQPTSLAQSKRRHARIDRLVRAGANAIGLVPDADVAARLAHGLVESLPSREVEVIARLGVALKVIETAPILHGDRPAERVTEAAKVRIGIKLLQHRSHCAERRPPGSDLPGLVDAHPDQEHDKVAVDLRAHSLRNDGSGHGVLPLSAVREAHNRVTQACRIALRPPRTSLRQRSTSAVTSAGSLTFSP